MKLSLSRSLKIVYRKEPISTFIFLMAMADVILGGINEKWTLLSFGVLMVMMSVFIRWVRRQKVRKSVFYSPPRRYLNPSTSSSNLTPLPPLRRKRDYRQNL